ncbi:hypothetical protein [Sphingomonas sanxanigenens]|uniref:hypothetical protein n=1 Tax=Sphingomonas sanxanigenens TaxID=397260 RepID=UPI0004ACFB08|nr:hypothetical protein [Sphingomonas sanxanigenens]
MARLRRFIIPGIPHHVTQRGNGWQRVFFRNEDYRLYRDPLAEHCGAERDPRPARRWPKITKSAASP